MTYKQLSLSFHYKQLVTLLKFYYQISFFNQNKSDMKKTFLSLLTMLLIIMACNKETIDTDSIDQVEQELANLENGSANMRSSAPKIDICHYDDETSAWSAINISENAWPAHEGHGDIRLDLEPFAQLLPETEFDGSDENVIDLGSFNFPANTDFTFVGQVYPIDLNTFGRIWDFGPADSKNFRFHKNTGNKGRVAVGKFTHVLTIPNYWELNTWIDVAVQYSGTTKEMRLYKNGQLVGTRQNVTINAGLRDNLIIGGSNWCDNFPNSCEPNTVMKTRNLRFYFAEIAEECFEALLAD